ncbi:phage protein GemA/Gp16 family protein [Lysobacter sp. CA199]|uniref:phage protein GemA/Gp16 family protein n=1 Tax=Lysobacter sp. CA199 TaxID=3455608 RepID=UPI003F8D5472
MPKRRDGGRPKSDRNRQLARIHMAQQQAGLDDDAYRDLLERVTGKRSASAMTPGEHLAVLGEFARLAPRGRAVRAAAKKGRAYLGRPRDVAAVPLLTKIEALLADASREWAYAHGLAKRMFRVNRLEWCNADQLRRLVAALQIDANRRAATAADADQGPSAAP